MDPANSRSPENITPGTSWSPYGARKVTDPRVWPGRVVDHELQAGQLERLAVGELRTSSGSANS